MNPRAKGSAISWSTIERFAAMPDGPFQLQHHFFDATGGVRADFYAGLLCYGQRGGSNAVIGP
jgi:hypothetical protein